MLRKVFPLILFLLITTPVWAVGWPPEVKPEQGRASGTLGIGDDDKLNVTIDFWNVGVVGGGDYGKVIVDLGCTQKTIGDGWQCVADDEPPEIGTFSGGPNGEITINGETSIQLVNGTYFKSNLDKTFQATVENPDIFSKYNWSGEEPVEGTNLTIVIPKNFFGGGAEDRRIEVKNGVINSTVPFRFRPSEDFTNAVIKGTYDPESGVLETTIVIAPHEEGAEFLMEFDGTMKADLSKENTAGFMTIDGNLWQWMEGEDKGPAGDFTHRVYYSVEYPADKNEKPAGSKPVKEPVDSNLHFWLTTSSQPSGEDTNAFIKRPGSNELEKVNEKTRINVGDTIVNPPDGKIITIYPTDWPESGIGLQPGTNFTISDKAQLLTMGEFIYKSTKDPKSGLNMQYDSFEMQMAKLSAKVKGTTVVVKEDGETSSIKVIEGVAEVTDIQTGKTVEISEGKMIAATDTGIGEVQAFDVNAENEKWQDFTDEIGKTGTNQKNYLYLLGIPAILAAVIGSAILVIKRKRRS